MWHPIRVPIRPATAGWPFPSYDAESAFRSDLVLPVECAAQCRGFQSFLLTADGWIQGLCKAPPRLSELGKGCRHALTAHRDLLRLPR